MTTTRPTAAPAWYADPHVPGQLRWWDGVQWTAHVAPAAAPAPVAEVAPKAVKYKVKTVYRTADMRRLVAQGWELVNGRDAALLVGGAKYTLRKAK